MSVFRQSFEKRSNRFVEFVIINILPFIVLLAEPFDGNNVAKAVYSLDAFHTIQRKFRLVSTKILTLQISHFTTSVYSANKSSKRHKYL